MTYEPNEGLDGSHDEADELDQQFREVEESRLRDKRQKLWLFILFMIALTSLLISGWLLVQSWAEKDTAVQQVAAEQQEKQEIAQEAQEALCGTGEREIYDREICEMLAEAANQPAPPADEVTQTEIVQAFRQYCEAGNCRGANGRTPTAEEVAAAFSRFCADGKCRGPAGEDAPIPEDGEDGADAPPPTPEMMLAAVTTYCADGRCVGDTGAQGEQGPPPTAEAIAAAVQAFCANGACVGPAGADSTVPGPPGAASTVPGPPGRGVASVQCDSPTPVTFTFTYSDGATETTQCGGAPPDPLEELIGP